MRALAGNGAGGATGGGCTRPGRERDCRGGIAARRSTSVFTRIVVPLDGSEESLAALRTAHALAARTGATMGLLHVIERALPQAAISQAERGAARHWLREAAHSVQTDDEPVTVAVRSGQPAATILAYARE